MSTTGTLGGYAKGPFSVDWEERYDMARLRRDRIAAAQRELAAAGADGLMVWKDENVRYLTSLRAQLIAGKTMALNGALLQPGADPVLLCSGGEIDKARGGMDWIAEAHAIPIMEQAELVDGFVRSILRPILAARGLDGGRLGVDAASVSFIEALRSHLPEVEVIDGDTIMQRAR
ncbi:MAG: hypothetical protein F4011_00375, partial [Acidimicrobiaceae bacterium]|nr:hypothetical protein [Acidimicrobiaceae bacterium]